jgi:hypothetical protein
MKSYKQFMEEIIPDTPQLILGKLGVNPSTIPPGSNRARVDAVQKAERNKTSPYTGKLRPNKRGMPRV